MGLRLQNFFFVCSCEWFAMHNYFSGFALFGLGFIVGVCFGVRSGCEGCGKQLPAFSKKPACIGNGVLTAIYI